MVVVLEAVSDPKTIGFLYHTPPRFGIAILLAKIDHKKSLTPVAGGGYEICSMKGKGVPWVESFALFLWKELDVKHVLRNKL